MDQEEPFPFAVDIPIPPAGLGPMLTVLLGAVQACRDGAVLTCCRGAAGRRGAALFNRILVKRARDAQRFEQTFRSIGARRVR